MHLSTILNNDRQHDWLEQIKSVIEPSILQFDEPALIKYSMDYHHFSPVLSRQLKDKIGECIASPRTEEELDQLLSFAAQHQIPITLRGNGTGNYGQAVPVNGGIVLNFAKYNKVLEVSEGVIRVQAGARIGKIESVGRKAGMEMRTMPSTFQSATIGGFLCGGFGGIGSITWGTIWDGLVRSIKIKTAEQTPRTIVLTGDEIRPYLHTYGTVGILFEIEINMAPAVEWMQWAVTFDHIETAVQFGYTLATSDSISKRLISVHESPIPAYFTPLALAEGKAVALLEIASGCEQELLEQITAYGGSVERRVEASEYHRGVGVSDFSWNHTTLWGRQTDRNLTYLQLRYQEERLLEQMKLLSDQYPEVMHHIEFARQNGELLISGLPLIHFTTEPRLNELMHYCEEIGVTVNNPHTSDLESGGRSYSNKKLWEIKRFNDPFILLNQEKLKYLASENA